MTVKMRHLAGVAAICSALAGCTKPAVLENVMFGHRFSLSVGRTAHVGGNDPLRVTFVELVSDSRCPEKANCVQAGEAVVRLELETKGEVVSREVSTAPGKQVAELDRYRVELLSVYAVPRANLPIAPGDYAVELQVLTN